MLDDFVDVSKDEKQIMHLWNSFVRKQRYVLLSNVILTVYKVYIQKIDLLFCDFPSLLFCWVWVSYLSHQHFENIINE